MTKSEAREIIQRKCVLGSPNDPHRLIFDAGLKLRRRTGYVKLRQCNMYCLTGLKRGRDRDSRDTQGPKSGGAASNANYFFMAFRIFITNTRLLSQMLISRMAIVRHNLFSKVSISCAFDVW